MWQNAGGCFVSGSAAHAFTPHRTQVGPVYSVMTTIPSIARMTIGRSCLAPTAYKLTVLMSG